ncbi:MAG TPA: hypothetical protein VE135_20560 [Pyrinomonadaceae bacterium]|nr:hypothetical protein [Pyrinomonadaceae bacterium]
MRNLGSDSEREQLRLVATTQPITVPRGDSDRDRMPALHEL